MLRANATLLARMRAGWVPANHGRRTAWRAAWKGARALAAAAALALAIVLFDASIFAPFAVVMLGLALLFFGSVLKGDPLTEFEERAAAELSTYQQARVFDGRYVLTDGFDDASTKLMRRTHRAVEGVLTSRVNKEGLLDDVRNGVMLPAQEWEIARLLAKLSALRAEHREALDGGVIPEVAAVAEPLVRALDSSEAAVVSRVEALERYAAHVAEAERAYRAHHQIEELRAKLPRYEELLAESGADRSAVPEIDRLVQDAERLEQALRRSVESAQDAFRSLES
ncbi:hypothetical protein ACIBG8_10440 [Nonomuraea sp. NPDC050556]|uniref:hypothetical protein n=1 Tax=Nonomuraea sp. NPDC050556 TaxID=3364369 RepID=UPI0037A81FDD